MGSDESVLLCADLDGVRTLTLNRPHHKNAIDAELWAALQQTLRATAEDRGVRAVVVTGAGGDFCSGADISTPDNRHPTYRMRDLTEVALALHELPMPSVAKVRGVAVGAGWNLALGCDFVVATAQARFSQIFPRRGLSPDLGGSWLLPKIVGLQQAKRLALLGDTIDGEQALAMNLVTWLHPDDELDGVVDDLARRLAAGPPVALAQTKALLNEGADRTLREALAGEARAQGINFATADAPEAFAAFAEKRQPRFTGRWTVTRPPVRSADRPDNEGRTDA
ncbi:enoyl-CoA hydratase-related protein [Nocardia sp. NPDC052254]|uniref:enoyl-CoA hydratase/isomerase family protein n=1 Tax=Nocardia sp. NPDC052254 TaxID=3155681 RepID=UPI00344628D1